MRARETYIENKIHRNMWNLVGVGEGNNYGYSSFLQKLRVALKFVIWLWRNQREEGPWSGIEKVTCMIQSGYNSKVL